MTEGKKRIVSITLEPPQAEFLHYVEENYGTKAATFLRNLLQKRMEEEEDRQKPQIVYYATQPTDKVGLPTTLPSSVYLPHAATSRAPKEVVCMVTANEEIKALLAATKGKPRKALKKVSKAELKAWNARPILPHEEKVIRMNRQEEYVDEK